LFFPWFSVPGRRGPLMVARSRPPPPPLFLLRESSSSSGFYPPSQALPRLASFYCGCADPFFFLRSYPCPIAVVPPFFFLSNGSSKTSPPNTGPSRSNPPLLTRTFPRETSGSCPLFYSSILSAWSVVSILVRRFPLSFLFRRWSFLRQFPVLPW